jgi:hypothetical protein
MEAYRNPLEPRTKWRPMVRRLAFISMAGLLSFGLMKVNPDYLVAALLAGFLWIVSAWKN